MAILNGIVGPGQYTLRCSYVPIGVCTGRVKCSGRAACDAKMAPVSVRLSSVRLYDAASRVPRIGRLTGEDSILYLSHRAHHNTNVWKALENSDIHPLSDPQMSMTIRSYIPSHSDNQDNEKLMSRSVKENVDPAVLLVLNRASSIRLMMTVVVW